MKLQFCQTWWGAQPSIQLTKDIPLHSTGNEEVYVRALCLGTKADVTKMKPFRVF